MCLKLTSVLTLPIGVLSSYTFQTVRLGEKSFSPSSALCTSARKRPYTLHTITKEHR